MISGPLKTADGLPSLAQVASIHLAAREAILSESEACKQLASALPEAFAESVLFLSKICGKVVTSGIGKSGHIARKIASTLSSTGTPSCFLHPTEASHGDLGLLTAEDALVLLSNSGETDELAPLIQYAHRFRIPLIAITSNKKSTLAMASNWVLDFPPTKEICPLGFAPTTSAVLMLALGDALSVCLLTLKEFKISDYHVRHPGGLLGQKLLKAQNIMTTLDASPLVPLGTPMTEALLVMTSKGRGCLGIVDPSQGAKLVGLITDGDLRRHMSPTLLQKSVDDVMTRHPQTISPDTLVAQAVSFMNENNITVLFVCEESQKPLGLIHLHDCLRAKIY
jgi:arabinose-5-phosphate isomerase